MSEKYVKGLDETLAILSTFPRNLQNNAMRQGLRAAGNVIRDEARLRAPKRSGALAKSIGTGSPRKIADGVYSVSVRTDPKKKNAFLGLFFEYGVAPHYITAGDANGISVRTINRNREGASTVGDDALVINGQFVRGAILHPGFAPKPFMRPALDIKTEEAVDAMADKVRAFVESYTGFKSAA